MKLTPVERRTLLNQYLILKSYCRRLRWLRTRQLPPRHVHLAEEKHQRDHKDNGHVRGQSHGGEIAEIAAHERGEPSPYVPLEAQFVISRHHFRITARIGWRACPRLGRRGHSIVFAGR